MTRFEEQVAGAIAALRIHSADAWAWFGRRFERRQGQALCDALARHLYAHFYCPGLATPAAGPLERAASAETTRFVALLSRANTGRGSWQPGWRLVGEQDDALVLERDGLRVWAAPSEVAALDDGECAAWREKERLSASPGFYLALGDAADAPASLRVRIYLNVTDAGAPELVAALTRRLNRRAIPFGLKVLNDRRAFMRCDAAVLYLEEEHRRVAEPHVLEIAARLATPLRRRVPALTKELAPGVGFAEDSGGEGSFGTERCGLIADAVLHAHRLGATSPQERLSLVAERFAAAGADLDRPYLRPAGAVATPAVS